jgi:hypothetical protein
MVFDMERDELLKESKLKTNLHIDLRHGLGDRHTTKLYRDFSKTPNKMPDARTSDIGHTAIHSFNGITPGLSSPAH